MPVIANSLQALARADPCMHGRAGVRAIAELINGDGSGVLNIVAGVSDILVRSSTILQRLALRPNN